MAIVKADSARAFVRGVKLPSPPIDVVRAVHSVRGPLAAPAAAPAAPPLELKDKDAQALVVGSSLVAAAENVPAEVRKDLVNCTLFAQLAASGTVVDASNVTEWYRVYFDTLTTLGWAQNGTNFREFTSKGTKVETHKSIIQVISLALGPTAAAATLIVEALNALQSMEENSPWITLFDRQSTASRSARFQVATAQYADTGLLEIALVAFDLKSKAALTQVLFFKAASSSIKLKYADGKATIYEDALEKNRADVAARLDAYRSAYVKEVKFPPPPAAAAANTRGAPRGRGARN